MKKTKIQILSLGHLPADVNLEKVENWKSDIFELSGKIEHYELRADSDGQSWEYSDENIYKQLPKQIEADFLIALVGVPLEDNWYTRRVEENVVVFTFHEISNFLRQKNIPLENVALRLLYAYSLVYVRNNNKIPSVYEVTNFTHDETRGCIYDMNGLKEDIVFSCDHPIICNDCTERLIKEKISQTTINQVKLELSKINKALFYKLTDWVKRHPIFSILISSIWAVLLGLAGSLLGKLFE
ncbi:MAG: hypothetical protein ABXS93_05820 [Sulfurimonas sp.]